MESIPYDKRSGKIWFNGKTVDWKDANIHVLNHGLHYASCVFEGERVYDGEIFKLEEHTERLFYSAKRMGIEVPYSQKEINDACKKIISTQKINGAKFVITESLFSMTGTTPDITEIYRICSENNAFLIVDEAHAIGVYGLQGRGLATHADLTIGTFGKAFGSQGAFLTCSQKLKQYLVATCRGLIYTTAPSPAILGSILAALDLITTMEDLMPRGKGTYGSKKGRPMKKPKKGKKKK